MVNVYAKLVSNMLTLTITVVSTNVKLTNQEVRPNVTSKVNAKDKIVNAHQVIY